MEVRGYKITVDRADDGGRDGSERERFGELPARIPFEAMVAVQPASPRNPVGDGYAAESSWRHGACAALDPGI